MPFFILFSLSQYLQYRSHLGSLSIMYFVLPLVVVLPMYFGSKKAAKSIITLELILNESGVEKKAEMSPYRKIAWQDLGVQEKGNGTVVLYDKRVSSFLRWWNGTGRIIVPPEILNREQLLTELYKYQTVNF